MLKIGALQLGKRKMGIDMMDGRCLSKQCRKLVDFSWWCRLIGWLQLLRVTGVANDSQYAVVVFGEGE